MMASAQADRIFASILFLLPDKKRNDMMLREHSAAISK
jgi:hypothetical protein